MSIKKGDKISVKFSVGVNHPLYGKWVEAIVDFVGGYDGKQIHATTVKEVYHEYDPKGLLVYDEDGRFIGYQPRAAYSEVYSDYVDEVNWN